MFTISFNNLQSSKFTPCQYFILYSSYIIARMHNCLNTTIRLCRTMLWHVTLSEQINVVIKSK